MKFFLISDNVETLTGMRLAGINGVMAREREEVLAALSTLRKDKEVGIVLITESLAATIDEEYREIKLNSQKPIITVIPDRHGARRKSDYITNYIKESIGIKI